MLHAWIFQEKPLWLLYSCHCKNVLESSLQTTCYFFKLLNGWLRKPPGPPKKRKGVQGPRVYFLFKTSVTETGSLKFDNREAKKDL